MIPFLGIDLGENALCSNIFHVHQLPAAVAVESAGIAAHGGELTSDGGIVPNANAGEVVLIQICQTDIDLGAVAVPLVIAERGQRQRCPAETPVGGENLPGDSLTDDIAVLCGLDQLERTALISHIARCAATDADFLLGVFQSVSVGECEPC